MRNGENPHMLQKKDVFRQYIDYAQRDLGDLSIPLPTVEADNETDRMNIWQLFPTIQERYNFLFRKMKPVGREQTY